MKKCLLLLSFFAFSSFQQVSVLSFTNLHVMKAAEGQLSVYTSRILPGDAGNYGFRNEDDMELLTIEKPYRIIAFNSDFYEHELDDSKNYVVIKNEWKVPVAAKGANRAMLTVTGVSSNYKVMGMGDTSLAREVQPVSRGTNDSDEFYLLSIPPLSAAFFVHEGSGSFIDAEFVPLSSASAVLRKYNKSNKDAYTLTEVQELVKAAIAVRAKQEEEKAVKPAPTKKPAPAKKKTTAAVKKPVPAK